MATKAEISALKEEIERLNTITENLTEQLNTEIGIRQDLAIQLVKTQEYNNNLMDSLSRSYASDGIAKDINFDLMYALAYLGKELRSRDADKGWHLCNPATRVTNAMSADNQQNSR